MATEKVAGEIAKWQGKEAEGTTNKGGDKLFISNLPQRVTGESPMRIYTADNDKSLNEITVYLTKEEARELSGSLLDMIQKPSNNHAHINDHEHQKEISICIYDANNLEGFDARSQKIILYDK